MQPTLEQFIVGEGLNTASVREFADRIRTELKSSTAAWWQVADILKEAEAQYTFASKEMKELIADVGFSVSKANKLVQISTSVRLKEHKSAISTVSAWTVLYRISTHQR